MLFVTVLPTAAVVVPTPSRVEHGTRIVVQSVVNDPRTGVVSAGQGISATDGVAEQAGCIPSETRW